MIQLKRGKYVGPRKDIRGHTAVLRAHPEHRDWVQAQFDVRDFPICAAFEAREDVMNDLAFGWTTFPKRDFRPMPFGWVWR